MLVIIPKRYTGINRFRNISFSFLKRKGFRYNIDSLVQKVKNFLKNNELAQKYGSMISPLDWEILHSQDNCFTISCIIAPLSFREEYIFNCFTKSNKDMISEN